MIRIYVGQNQKHLNETYHNQFLIHNFYINFVLGKVELFTNHN